MFLPVESEATKNNRIFFEEDYYYSIVKFDCRVVDLNTTNNGGTFLTVIPISDKDYRVENPDSRAKVYISEDRSYVIFDIRDDWGRKHTMKIPKDMKKEICDAIEGAIKQNLPLIPKKPIAFELSPSTPFNLPA